jgi:hypothetical protein
MYSNTTGQQNIAIGHTALYDNTTGIYNVCVGTLTLRVNTASFGTAIGHQSLTNNTTGANNTGVGYQAGFNITTGSNNVCVGNGAGTDANGNISTASNYVIIGNQNITNANIRVAWTVTSDIRDKNVLGDVPHGLAFVNKLNPIKYQFKKSREDDTPHGPVRYGFPAQDILSLEGDSPVIINVDDPANLKYNDAYMTAVLVNAIKELSAQVEELKTRVK